MSTRNLNALFDPRSIALVGASNEAGSVGQVLARNLFSGGFSGPIWPVNPHQTQIREHPCYSSHNALPGVPDLAVIATPPHTVPAIVADLGKHGCRASIVISAGFDTGRRNSLLTAAKPNLMRIMGPNCLGFLSPVRGVNASFAHRAPDKGNLAFVTQSGAIATSIIDWAIGKGIGFSHMLSLGDMSDIDFGDLLDFLALDASTHAILLYAEGITQARKFMSAARIASRAKPVIVVKAGRSTAGAKAAASHTGALAGADAVYDAAFRRAGMLRVTTLRDLFDAAETLASGVRVHGRRLAILTNGGGLGVIAADALEQRAVQPARLSEDTLDRLNRALPATWSHGNPVDIVGDAHGDRYEAALDVLAGQPELDAILVMNCPTGVSDNQEAAQAVLRARARHPSRSMIGCWMGEVSASGARRILSEAQLPNYETPEEAVSAFLHLADFVQNQTALFETPSAKLNHYPTRAAEARAIVQRVLGEPRGTLTEPEAKSVLAAYNIPVVRTVTATTPAEAGAAADTLGGPVVLKILSRQISHKSDVGGVKLDLVGGEATERAASNMLSRIGALRPDAIIDGFTVQPMVKRPHAQELLLGAVIDPTFGPCLMFGHGGVATEVVADRCLGLPPLNVNLALDMIARTRVARLLAGYRDRGPVKLEAIAAALISLSDLVIDNPEIAELDINPLLADADGVVALDARIIVKPVTAARAGLAIRPYPDELIQSRTIGGLAIRLRPIRPEDASGLVEMAERTDPNDLRMRFHGAVGSLSAATSARLSQIDHDREMVLIAEPEGGSIAGVVRLVFSPDFDEAEGAIIVRTDLQNRGIGQTLLRSALDYARSRGAQRVWGDVLVENRPLLEFARKLGGDCTAHPSDRRTVRVAFTLATEPTP